MEKGIENKNCPLCHEELFSDVGIGCKMCGMTLENESSEFCSEDCRGLFEEIHKGEINQIIGKITIIK